MGRKPNPFPVPTIRQRNDSFQVRWTYKGITYGITLSNTTKDNAKRSTASIAAALAEQNDWPPEIIVIPAVKRYLAHKAGNDIITDNKTLIEKYANHMKKTTTSNWHTTVKAHLLQASEITGTLLNASTEALNDFLEYVAENTSNATRNRAQMALSGFFRYLRTMKYFPKGHNPLEGIKQARETRPETGITVWEESEIPALLKAADTRRDGIAIWIAILAGLRRGEIAALKWSNISPTCISIEKSKTGRKRQVPLSKMLAERLNAETRSSGKIVPWPDALNGWQIAARRLFELHLPKAMPTLFEMHPEKFSWNPCRHTFASRHAQRGIPIDVIAAWLGDSPAVCREHYARYVPATMRDTRIDGADMAL